MTKADEPKRDGGCAPTTCSAHVWRWHATGAGLGWNCDRCGRHHRFTGDEDSPPRFGCSGGAENPPRMKARVDGACAALEGKKLGANPHPEGSDLHWEWLQGWTSAKLQKLR